MFFPDGFLGLPVVGGSELHYGAVRNQDCLRIWGSPETVMPGRDRLGVSRRIPACISHSWRWFFAGEHLQLWVPVKLG